MRVVFALAFIAAMGATPAAAKEALVFGVVPQQSASEIHKRWTGLAAYLSETLGRRVELATAPDIPRFEACLAGGAYDIAYMNPYHYVVFHDLVGYEAVARRNGPPLHGILVAPADSPARSREDLDGARVAFPSLGAFGASVIQRVELRNLGVRIEPHFVKSHASVYMAVARGYFEAGGGVMRTLNAMDEETRAALRVIYVSDGYTPHAFAAHPRIDAGTRDRVSEALAAAAEASPESVEPLRTGPLVRASDAEWDDVRALDIAVEDAGLVTAPARIEECRSAPN